MRGPVDPNFPGLPGPIEYIVERNQNVGNLRTSAIDIDVSYRGHITFFGRFGFNLNGTYIAEWKEQFYGVNYTSVAGTNINGTVPRWGHYLALNWDSGPWSAALAQTFQDGYSEQDNTTFDADGNCGTRRVGTYSIWGPRGTYSGLEHTKIALGVKNLFDRAPPFAQQSSGRFEAGYDGTNADARGRMFYARVTLGFR